MWGKVCVILAPPLGAWAHVGQGHGLVAKSLDRVETFAISIVDRADSDAIEQVSSGGQVAHNDFTPQLERWKLAEFFYFRIRRGLVLGRHALILSTRNRNGTN